MPRVLRSKLAASDLIEVSTYIAADGERAADRMLERHTDVATNLAENPSMGRLAGGHVVQAGLRAASSGSRAQARRRGRWVLSARSLERRREGRSLGVRGAGNGPIAGELAGPPIRGRRARSAGRRRRPPADRECSSAASPRRRRGLGEGGQDLGAGGASVNAARRADVVSSLHERRCCCSGCPGSCCCGSRSGSSARCCSTRRPVSPGSCPYALRAGVGGAITRGLARRAGRRRSVERRRCRRGRPSR